MVLVVLDAPPPLLMSRNGEATEIFDTAMATSAPSPGIGG